MCCKGTERGDIGILSITDSHLSKTVCAASVKMRPAFSPPASRKLSTLLLCSSCPHVPGLHDQLPPSRGDAASARTCSLLVHSLVRVGDPEEADDLELARLPSCRKSRSVLCLCLVRTGDVDEPDDLAKASYREFSQPAHSPLSQVASASVCAGCSFCPELAKVPRVFARGRPAASAAHRIRCQECLLVFKPPPGSGRAQHARQLIEKVCVGDARGAHGAHAFPLGGN